jgi:3-oxoadipate enol-lactonase
MLNNIEITIRYKGHKLVALFLNPENSHREPIILLHGITSSMRFWIVDNPFIEFGACYSLSLPGHYPATCIYNFSIENFVDILTESIYRLVGNQPVTLVGHSTGAFAALAIAAHTPNMVRRIICISGFAQGKWIGLLGLNQWLADFGVLGRILFKVGFRGSRINRTIFRQVLQAHIFNTESVFSYPYFETFVDISFRDYKKLDLNTMLHYFKTFPKINITFLLPRITASTLVLTGDNDPTVPTTQAYLISKKVPRATLEIISNSGHLPFMENSIEYREKITAWLKQTT